MKKSILSLWILIFFFINIHKIQAEESLKSYTEQNIPKNAIDLWNDYDPRKDSLDIKIIKQWENDGVVCNYLTFKVGTFKGKTSRIAAYYTYPKGLKARPAFVYSHGGGQRADIKRGLHFSKLGYAVLDINWNGRECEKGIQENTDWGNVDPTQGPRFYPKALRENWKRSFTADEYSIDPFLSPRNSNWFLLALTARRAITFLEKQPEVDKNKIGFTGYSMGGTITAMTAIDSRLKAVVPMVGGTGFKDIDLDGLPNTSRSHIYKNKKLYADTIDCRAYWPHVKIPVMFLNSSNDFHAVFERVSRAMKLIPHKHWWTSHRLHTNHQPGAKQWVLTQLFFDKFLKGKDITIPKPSVSSLEMNRTNIDGVFRVIPEYRENLKNIKIYYSNDPNGRNRFWKNAKAIRQGNQWLSFLEIKKNLPLYVFASCTYRLNKEIQSFAGKTTEFEIDSVAQIYLPQKIDLTYLKKNAKNNVIFEDFKNGQVNWSKTHNGGLESYKLRDPENKLNDSQGLQIFITPPEGSYQLRVMTNSTWITNPNNRVGRCIAVKRLLEKPKQNVIFKLSDFKKRKKTNGKVSWNNFETIQLELYDLKNHRFVDLKKNPFIVNGIHWTDL